MRLVSKIILTITFFSIVAGTLIAQSDQYLEIKATKGQTAFGLLRKYKLLDQACHLDAFFVLNDMKHTVGIVDGRKYKLPVKLVRFDGKTIRTSLNINEIKKAKEIEAYNQVVLSENLRKQDYKKSKLLWVPLAFESCNVESASSKNKVQNDISGLKNKSLPQQDKQMPNQSPI